MRRVLLVIDMLNDFIDPAGSLYCGKVSRKIIQTIRFLIDLFKAEGNHVVYLRDAHAEDDKEFELFRRHAVKGTWGSQVIPELAPPVDDIIVDKNRFSGFYGNNLDRVLARIGPDEVWVTGVVTSICVMDTVGGLRNRDYAVVVPVDAVADFDPDYHRFALDRMVKVYGTRLINTTDLMNEAAKK